MRAGDYTPLASSEIQKWDSVSTEASGEAAFFVTRVEIFTWYVQAPESARGPTASERLFFITGNTETLGDFDFEKKIPLELDADESEDAGKQVYTADVHLPVLPVVYRVLEVDAVTKKVIFQTGLLLK